VSFADGTTVVLVDTPGFDDTYLSDFDILENVAKWLKNVYVSILTSQMTLNDIRFFFFSFFSFAADELANWIFREYSIYIVSLITEWETHR
jgi:hypothetical protein